MSKQTEKEADEITEGKMPGNHYNHLIKDCPLCGGKAGEEVIMGFKHPSEFIINCTPCHLRIIMDRPDKVIGTWNMRKVPDLSDVWNQNATRPYASFMDEVQCGGINKGLEICEKAGGCTLNHINKELLLKKE